VKTKFFCYQKSPLFKLFMSTYTLSLASLWLNIYSYGISLAYISFLDQFFLIQSLPMCFHLDQLLLYDPLVLLSL
jgi:hypothetical protein